MHHLMKQRLWLWNKRKYTISWPTVYLQQTPLVRTSWMTMNSSKKRLKSLLMMVKLSMSLTSSALKTLKTQKAKARRIPIKSLKLSPRTVTNREGRQMNWGRKGGSPITTNGWINKPDSTSKKTWRRKKRKLLLKSVGWPKQPHDPRQHQMVLISIATKGKSLWERPLKPKL